MLARLDQFDVDEEQSGSEDGVDTQRVYPLDRTVHEPQSFVLCNQ